MSRLQRGGFALLVLAWLVVVFYSAAPNYAQAGYIGDLRRILPQLHSIEVRGTDVMFNNDYQIPGSKWELWSGGDIEISKTGRFKKTWPPCGPPSNIWKQYKQPNQRLEVVLCDGDRIWFATSSYCSEGHDDQGALFSYDHSARAVTTHEDLIPRCEAISGAVRIDDEIWFSLIRPGEWGPYSGSGILIYEDSSEELRLVRGGDLTSRVIRAIAYNSADQSVWLTTKSGIDRYSIKTKSWEHRYFKPTLTVDNRLTTILVEQRPDIGDIWMVYHLYIYPIPDRAGFARTWQSLERKYIGDELPIPVMNAKLLPFYVSALDHIKRDDVRANLVRDISLYKGIDAQTRAALEKYK